MADRKLQFVKAARADEIPPGKTKIVSVNGRPVLLANWAGQVFASAAVCPHQFNSLEGAQVGDFQLQCPWHYYRYDLRTGENVYPKNVYPLGASDIDQARLKADIRPLRMYPVELRGADIYVGVP